MFQRQCKLREFSFKVFIKFAQIEIMLETQYNN